MARRSTRSATDGRYVRRGMTWTSAAVTVAVIVVAIAALGLLARRFEAEYPVTASLVDHRLSEAAEGCALEFDIELRNGSDRDLRLLSAEIEGMADTRRGIRGVFSPGESIVRTFNLADVECGAPLPERLSVRYGPTLSSAERSVLIEVDPA